jgi:hypothetical protein
MKGCTGRAETPHLSKYQGSPIKPRLVREIGEQSASVRFRTDTIFTVRDYGTNSSDRGGSFLFRRCGPLFNSPGATVPPSLMSIHEHLPPQARKDLKEVGWTKGLELAKVARRDGQEFDCATWLHKARSLPKDQFKREVEKELTGKESEPWEIIYFKLYKTQIPVVEQALETAALMLGTDKSRGTYLLA